MVLHLGMGGAKAGKAMGSKKVLRRPTHSLYIQGPIHKVGIFPVKRLDKIRIPNFIFVGFYTVAMSWVKVQRDLTGGLNYNVLRQAVI